MRTFLIPLLLTLGACVSAKPDTISLSDQGPMARQVERVLTRHDNYVIADLSLADPAAALAESDAVRTLAVLPEVRRDVLGGALAPVMDRHDRYVSADPVLDDLRRATYLAATEQLRRLLLPPR